MASKLVGFHIEKGQMRKNGECASWFDRYVVVVDEWGEASRLVVAGARIRPSELPDSNCHWLACKQELVDSSGSVTTDHESSEIKCYHWIWVVVAAVGRSVVSSVCQTGMRHASSSSFPGAA